MPEEPIKKQAESQDDIVIPVRDAKGKIILRDISGKKLPKKPGGLAPEEVARRVLEMVEKPSWSDRERNHLSLIIASFVNDVRDRTEAREQLKQPSEKGGLALSDTQAEWMVNLIDAIKQGKPVPAQQGKKIPVQIQTDKAELKVEAPEQKPVYKKTQEPGAFRSPKPTIQKPQAEPKPVKRRQDVYADIAKEIVDQVQPKLPKNDLRSRLEALVVTRFRDVRDANEVKAHMGRDVLAGGLGMEKVEVERFSAVLEKRVAQIGKELHEQERKSVLTGIKGEQETRQRKKVEKQEMDEFKKNKWYEERFIQKKKPGAIKPTTVPASPKKAAPLQVEKPTMRDVVYTPKVVGPVNELEGIRMEDFRQLSKKPSEATARILDKIRLIEEEDYTKRVKAIAAWKKSEPMREYLSITRKMLEGGKSSQDVIKETLERNPDAMTQEEYDAIMGMQKDLRY